MYIDTYIAIPLWIFAIFGFLYFLLHLFNSLGLIMHKKRGVYTLVVSAKNQEDAIEGVIRGFILKAGLDGFEEQLLQIVLVDLGSRDKTPKIMENLDNEYSIIKLLKPDDLMSYFRNLVYGKR